MNLLPIVERELRAATRRKGTYRSRVITAVVAVGLSAWVLQTLGAVARPELVGVRLFRIVTNLSLFFSLLAGVMLTADTLSQEKRDGTMGLLFLTNLKGHDVVLGKLFGTSLAPFCALLAVFPVLALPLILGGVTPGEFWRTVAALANAMFFGLASGLCVSAVSWHAQRAVLGAGTMVVAAWVLAGFQPPLTFFSPVTAFRKALDGPFTAQPQSYVASILLTHGLSWLMLGLASQWAPRRWRQDHASERIGVPKTAGLRAKPSFPVGETQPADWLAKKGMQQRWVWGSLGLAILGWTVGSLIGFGPLGLPFACIIGAVSIELVLQFWIAWEAGRRFGELRRTGLLETLLVSPVTTEEIVTAEFGSLRRQFLWPTLGVLTFQMGLIVFAAFRHRWMPGESPAFLAIMMTAMIWTVVTAYGLGWVGLWLGLARRKGAEAGLRALAWVVGAPVAAFMCVTSLVLAGGSRNLDGPSFVAALLILLGSVSAHLSAEFAQRMLIGRFRVVAAEAS